MLELDGLIHEYDGARAVDGVSLTIPDGEFLVLCGPNGSGKSTLVRHLNGLLEPDAGRVLVDGVDVSDAPVAARTTVGMAFQEPRDQFVAATVGGDVRFGPENLGLDHEEIDRRAANALSAVGLDGREDDRIETLSGGERERLAVAGALAMEPSHLVLDEPFTGLDSPARERLLARLRDLHADGTGLIVVTHDLRYLLDDADRVVCLADGEVVVDASPGDATEKLTEYGVRVPGR
ncbi:trehalose/maltose import ATP-binding protein MalK [Halolamina pelagica]|uniref:Trehalose/maltose import ATP-binding protein MalK n=1 Tax=Halolamina pelagica TaxID=699431 RepID=A0A0P7G8I2_9EURY|nr:ABC transporter ATP-binding protein [Halolamina pelagica]KPN29586.1 trehalose/maltose import ATP-binding protein MalK [Halolamina pelagica]